MNVFISHIRLTKAEAKKLETAAEAIPVAGSRYNTEQEA